MTYASIEYELYIQNDSQLYVNLPSLEFENEDYTDVEIITNGQVNRYTTDNVFHSSPLVTLQQEKLLRSRIAFPENSTVTFQNPEFLL